METAKFSPGINLGMHQHRRLYFHFALFLLAAVFLGACSKADDEPAAELSLGSPMPETRLLSVNGEIVDSGKLFSGKVVVFNLWATWCPPCRKEMPDLIRLSELLPADQFLVAGLSIDNNLEDVQSYIGELNIPFPMFWDTGGQKIATPVFKAFRYPETFIFNRHGRLVKRVVGLVKWDSPANITMLKTLYKTGETPGQGNGPATL